MSRIAGIVATNGQQDVSGLLDGMLEAYRRSSRVQLQDKIFNRTGAAFGWTGWDRACISEQPNVFGVADAASYLEVDFKKSFERSLQQLNGEFAIARFDVERRELLLARDRFGIKPLYYVVTPQFVAFASRPGALLALPGVSRDVNKKFVAIFAASHYRYIDNDPESSPYAQIRQVPAGAAVSIAQGKIQTRRWYSLEESGDQSGDEQALAEKYRELLLDAVSLRFRQSKQPTFTLSGGMDSSSVLSCAVATSGSPQEAYSTVYRDKTYDESDDIQSMLKSHVSRWNPVSIGTPELFPTVQKMIALHDEPIATATWLSHYLLCETVAEAGKKTLFGGLGGDELNAGEYEYFFFFFADLRAQGREAELKTEVARWAEYHDHPIFKKNTQVMEDGLKRMVDLKTPGRCLPEKRRLGRYFSTLNREYFDLEAFQPAMDHPFQSYLKNRTFQDIFRETAPCCLRAEDRHATAFGLENHLPFFDHRVVEFMFRIPGTLKIREGVTKYLLRNAMRGILPEETRTRVKKTGWNAPAHRWFVEEPNRSQLHDLVASKSFGERGIYNVSEVKRLIAEHEEIINTNAERENHMMFLWQLVNLELWFARLRESEQ